MFRHFNNNFKPYVKFRRDEIERNEIGFDTDFSTIGPKRTGGFQWNLMEFSIICETK